MTTTVLDTKIGEVKNKIPDVNGLVKKTNYNSKISDIAKKYFTPSDYNKFTKKILDGKIKERGLVDKSDISNLVKNSDLNKKLVVLTAEVELKAEQDKTVKLQVFDSSLFLGKSNSEDDGTQNCLLFQSVSRYFDTVAHTSKVIL